MLSRFAARKRLLADAFVGASSLVRFPAIKTFNVEQALGSWSEVQTKHFADGAVYDQIIVQR